MMQASRPVTSSGYHAFLSYSHADEAVARGVQKALQGIGRRVGRPGALRVFRDDTDLSAAPDLWGRVRDAMDASAFLIVVLSPAAAASEWVDREVAHWLASRGTERLLFVLAGGTASYDEDEQRFDPVSDAVSPALLRPEVLPTEPVYVDVREDAPWDAAAPGFRDRVMSLAAEIQGRPKSELAGDDLREQQRYRRWRRSVMTGLSVLTVVSLVLAVVAVNRGAEASRQRDEAVGLALAASAQELVGVNDPLAVALASEAMAATDTPPWQAVKALVAARVSLADQRAVRIGAPMTGYDGYIGALAFSPDGKLLASGEEGAVRLWDPATRRQVGSPLTHEGFVSTLAFSPDGRILASAGASGTIKLWDPVDGRFLRETHTESYVTALAFSPDGSTLATRGEAGYDTPGVEMRTEVRLWDAGSVDPVGQPMVGPSCFPCQSVAFSTDGMTLAVGYDNWIGVWSPLTGQLARRLTLPPIDAAVADMQDVTALAFNAEGTRIVSVSADGFVRIWNPTRGGLVRQFSDSFFPQYDDFTAALSQDGRLLATQGGLWDTASGASLGSRGFVTASAVTFSREGSRAAIGSRTDGILLLDMELAELGLGTTSGGGGLEVRSMASSPDGSVGVVWEDGTASLVDPVVWQVIRELVPHGDFRAEHIEIGPKGHVAIAGTRIEGPVDGTHKITNEVRLVDQPGSLTSLKEVGLHRAIALTRRGEVLAVGGRGVDLFDTASGARLSHLDDACTNQGFGDQFQVAEMAVDPEGQVAAVLCAAEGESLPVQLWDLATGEVRGAPLNHGAFVSDFAFSADGSLVATAGDDGTVRLWNVSDGEPVGNPLTGQGAASGPVDFHVRGKLLASGGDEGTIRLWDPDSHQLVGLLPVSGGANALAFSPDGHTLVASMVYVSGEQNLSEMRSWTGLWEQDEGCTIAARYVDRAQLDPYLPEGWVTACTYAN